MIIGTLIRATDSVSIAALRTLISRGPRAARKVMGATAQAAGNSTPVHTMSYWDIVRSFPVAEDILIRSDGWFDGATAPLERFVLAHLVRYFRPEVILEVGTYRGTTTRLLLDNCMENARIYTMDLPPDQEVKNLTAASDERLIIHRKLGIDYKSHASASRVTQILGDSFEASTWDNVPNGIEFAFIDASHSYEAVRNDTERVFGKLHENGVVLWHDYSVGETAERGVGKFIRELMATREDIFVCSDTDVAIRIPRAELEQCAPRVEAFFPNGDYKTRFPNGPVPWITGK